jgi:hypothetical protein
VDHRPQETVSVGLCHERIDGLQSTVGQFQVVRQHHDWELWFNLLYLIRNHCPIHEVLGGAQAQLHPPDGT